MEQWKKPYTLDPLTLAITPRPGGHVMTWDNGLALTLIEEFRKREVLWDPKHHLYFNTLSKEAAWDEVGRAIGAPKLECKRKMESLKGSFRRERSRANREKRKQGVAPYTSRWFAYETMRFMEDRDDPRASRKPILKRPAPTDDKEEPVEEIIDIDLKYDAVPKSEFDSDVELDPTEESSDGYPVNNDEEEISIPHDSEQQTHTEDMLGFPDSVMVTSGENPSLHENQNLKCVCKDECATYGEHVAHKLRKLDERSRTLIQHRINNLLFKAEMKRLGYSESP